MVERADDLYRLKKEELSVLEGFGEKSAENLLGALEQSKKSTLDRVLCGLGIRNIGTKAAKQLAEHFGSIDAIMNATEQEIAEIYDFGDIMAENVAVFFAQEENRKLIEQLRSVGLEMAYTKQETADHLVGKTFVMSGGLESMSRDEASAIIERLGGKVSGSVSKKTSYLILGDKPGSKLTKAKELGIPVLEEDAFLKLIQGVDEE